MEEDGGGANEIGASFCSACFLSNLKSKKKNLSLNKGCLFHLAYKKFKLINHEKNIFFGFCMIKFPFATELCRN